MSEIIEYPVWTVALNHVLDSVEEDGYGAMFTHEELREWMGIEIPTTIEESKRSDFDYLTGMEKLKKELLEEHCICLDNVKGKGYIAAHPNDQVTNVVDGFLRKAREGVNKAAKHLNHVKSELLSAEAEIARHRRIERAVFIKRAFNKRKIHIVDKKQERIAR